MTLTPHRPEHQQFVEMLRTSLAPELREQPWDTPGAMAKALDRTTVQTPALDVIDDRLVRAARGELQRLAISMPPQEGKSTRTSVWFVVWMLHRNPNLRIAIVSATLGLARRFGGQIRDKLKANPQLGLTLAQDTKAKHEFNLLGYAGGVYAVGIDGTLTGRPVDLLIIDDPYRDSGDADSAAWQQTVRSFWTDVALTRLPPKASVILVQTRWRQDDLTGWLLAEGENWAHLNIPAQADHDPAKGETDVLDRQPGEFMISARSRTEADWEQKRREVGSRVWNALYQGRPSPAEGSIFQRTWWREYDQPPWVVRSDGAHIVHGFDDLLISWDMTFKGTEGTDYVAGQVWMRRGADAYLLDQVHGRMSFVETVAAVRQLAAKWPQAVLKLVEDKANGSAVLSMLERAVPGMVPVEPDGGKEARAAAVSPLVEGRNVWLPSPELAPWIGGFIDEAAGFPTAKHDDQVDAMSQALNRLILQPLLAGEELVEHGDLDDEMADFGGYVP